MEELKNIRNFKEFKQDAINEELLWDAVKKLFSTIFGKMDKKLADSIANFTKKLDGTKTWEDTVRVYREVEGDLKNKLNQNMEAAQDPLTIRKVLADNYRINYTLCQELAKGKFQPQEMLPANVFKGHPDEKIFNFNDAKSFEANLLQSMNAKMIELNKASQGVYDEKALTDYLKKNNNLDPPTTQQPAEQKPAEQKPAEQKPAEQKPTATTGTPEKTPVNPGNASNTSTFDNYTQKFSSKLFELAANEPNPNPNQPNTPNPTNTNQQTNQQQQTNTNQQGIKPLQGKDIKTFKEAVSKQLLEGLFGTIDKKLTSMKPPSKIGGEDAFFNLSKNAKGTENKETVAKMMRAINNLDKDKLKQVRDKIKDVSGQDPGLL